ncbi:IQ calmodulin-binding motif-containing protein 1 isoform X2 [Tachyglossus aculeatus]|uniref:IQ calmodulin-binding motif-containing protein 1 isoform X2 n=1 Tax=Tachyglossus aculeatus TaxID=9261 RepID=UPI0018F78197|nr:IQ calmodulin-binding motif-containing protein 1 isoform X2 [Tachyglossus aculeatus]
MEPRSVDLRVQRLAAEVAESLEQDVPAALLKLEAILHDAPSGSAQLRALQRDIHDYDLIAFCILVLRRDYSGGPGGWTTPTRLARILSHCCVGLEPEERAEEFYHQSLPSAVDNCLLLGRRLQARYIRSVKEEERAEYLRCFLTVMDSLCWLLGGHRELSKFVLRSDHFLQLLLTDDVETGVAVVTMLQSVLQASREELLGTEEEIFDPISDELVFKLSSSSHPAVGRVCTRALLSVAQSRAAGGPTLAARYKGLHSMLREQWTGKGFGPELGRLLALLARFPDCLATDTQRRQHAACAIQAAWRGFRTRQRLSKLPRAVTALQRSFRAKRAQEQRCRSRCREGEALRAQLQLQRQRARRRFLERQLILLEAIPPGQVGKHQQEVEERCALTIQRHWRGHRARRDFHRHKQSLREHKAAVTLQRTVLRFLARRRQERMELAGWQSWGRGPGLSDSRRLQLKQRVEEHLSLHPARLRTDAASRELHVQAQERLGRHLVTRGLSRRAEQRREAWMAQISTDIDQLMRAPGLQEATGVGSQAFVSRSRPVATQARQAHLSALRRSRQPWWAELREEPQEGLGAMEVAAAAGLDSLFVAGTKSP